MESITQSAKWPLTTLQSWVRRYPRRLSALLLTLLGGYGVAAFGIAPLAPDAADLPRRLIVEPIAVSGLGRQAEDLAFHELQLWRHETTRPSDTADNLLRRVGVADPQAAAFLRTDRTARRILEGRGGKMIQARTTADGSLQELVARYPALDEAQLRTHFTRLTVSRVDGRLHSQLETAPLQVRTRLGSGTIRSSLFAATDDAGLPDAIAAQLVDIFSTEIDFHRELRKGDSFSVVFESLAADEQPISWNEGTGRILAAEFTNHGRPSQAIWYTDPATGKGAYFGPDGRSKRRGFLASPLAFSRVTSGFAMRMHPILNTWRAHNGTDYAAPKGTPVQVVGDGLVEKAGWQNGYGNVVTVRHDGDRSTTYAHLSRINVRAGQRVVQGQSVGAVGATGWATGPHLHFEFRIAGQLNDPLTIARQSESVSLDFASKAQFQRLAVATQAHLVAADSMRGYRSDSE